jgi:hypothetical protein
MHFDVVFDVVVGGTWVIRSGRPSTPPLVDHRQHQVCNISDRPC